MPLSDSTDIQSFNKEVFADVLINNNKFVETFKYEDLTGIAKKAIAIITCMDSRISHFQ